MLKRHSLNIEHWLKWKLVWHVHKQSMKLKRLYLNNDCNYKGSFCRVIRWKFLFSGGWWILSGGLGWKFGGGFYGRYFRLSEKISSLWGTPPIPQYGMAKQYSRQKVSPFFGRIFTRMKLRVLFFDWSIPPFYYFWMLSLFFR